MCVCDLGGVYIKPTRPWVVAPLPSPLATVTLSPRLAVSPRHLVTSSPRHLVHLVTWSPGYLFTSGHLVAWLPCCLVTWSRCAVICSRLRVFAPFTFAPIFLTFPVSLFALAKFIPYCAPLLVFILVSILTFPALILQTRCTFCREYSFSSY